MYVVLGCTTREEDSTSKAAVDSSDGGLSCGVVQTKEHGRELREVEDAGNIENADFEEANFVRESASTIDQISACRSGNDKRDEIESVDEELGKTIMADEVYVDGGGVIRKVAGCCEIIVEAG